MLKRAARVRRWPPFYRTMLSGTAATVTIVTITAAAVFSLVVGREMRQSSRAFNHELLLQTRKVVETALGELFDLEADPGEITNHWSDPAYAEVKADLLARIIDHGERLEKRTSRDCYA